MNADESQKKCISLYMVTSSLRTVKSNNQQARKVVMSPYEIERRLDERKESQFITETIF